MKRFFSAIAVAVVAIALTLTTASAPAFAGDAAAGAKIFAANCAACHIGGGNAINSQKTLKKDALELYEMNSLEKITYQINNGKNAMPKFLGRLSDADIENVATYVLDQAEKGW